jgi:hypothetical protein
VGYRALFWPHKILQQGGDRDFAHVGHAHVKEPLSGSN